jgi:hypothetical protein
VISLSTPPFWTRRFAQHPERITNNTLFISTHSSAANFQPSWPRAKNKEMNIGQDPSSGDNVPRILIVHERRMKISSLITASDLAELRQPHTATGNKRPFISHSPVLHPLSLQSNDAISLKEVGN